MKIFSVLALLPIALSATALAELPLIEKHSGNGFVQADWRRSESCRVFLDRVEITRTYGDLATIETRQLGVNEASLMIMIGSARAEKEVSKPNYLCDGPSTSAYITGQNAEKNLTLFSTGGCGTPSMTREGNATRILMDMLGTYCPITNMPPIK
jgi:hypothetical protein